MKTAIAGGVMATGFALAGAGAASAAPQQDGLVNVSVVDTTVQIPVGIAANVCGVSANVLARAANVGALECTAEGVSFAEDSDGGGGSSPRQEGLINVALENTTVQVPVAVAANVCGVAVNVLSAAVNAGSVDCEAFADADAEA